MNISFFQPHITGKEIDYLKIAITSRHWAGDGEFSKKCADFLEFLTGIPVFMTPSGSSALELALMSLHLNPGDEVILPSFTFVSTANCIVQMGFQPVFIDIRADTLNIDERLIEGAITKKTKAIIVVHYAGVSAEMDTIRSIASKNGLKIVEDAAHGINAYYHGKALGTLGDLGIYSFHQTKNVSCGEGGAVLVRNEAYLKQLEIHRQKGTNRKQFLLGQLDKYSWVDRGGNYFLSDLLAAFLLAQLEFVKEITLRRKKIYGLYFEGLTTFSKNHFQLPVIPKNCGSNFHLFHILLENSTVRSQLMNFLKERGIEVAAHFVPLHSSEGGKKFGITGSRMSIADRVGDCILRLPFYTDMDEASVRYVIQSLKLFFD